MDVLTTSCTRARQPAAPNVVHRAKAIPPHTADRTVYPAGRHPGQLHRIKSRLSSTLAALLLFAAAATTAEPLPASSTAAPAAASFVQASTSSPRSATPFTQARTRGTLIVGIPYLAPEAVAGAKIRTPERLDTIMVERLGEQLGLPVKLVQIDPAQRTNALTTGQIDLLVADHIAGQSTPGLIAYNMPAPAGENSTRRTAQPAPAQANQHIAAIPTGYAARPKAIIRSDTTLQHWKDAKGRTVCMSTAAFQAQALAQQWGTTVRTYRFPSDALVAVREGNCDIGLIDDVTWAPLMKFPEWKKFSSTLSEHGPRAERVWLIPDHDAATKTWLTDTMKQWRRQGTINAMIEKWARDVAFDVYLDQEVPDCHGG